MEKIQQRLNDDSDEESKSVSSSDTELKEYTGSDSESTMSEESTLSSRSDTRSISEHDELGRIRLRGTGDVVHPPLNCFVVVKRYNRGKTNSHLWLYDVLLNTVRPKIVVNFDVGTFCESTALVRIVEALRKEPTRKILGYNRSGDESSDTEREGGMCAVSALIMPDESVTHSLLGRYQMWEYATGFLNKGIEHLLDLTLGAFSAYKWKQIARMPQASTDARLEEIDPRPLSVYHRMLSERHSLWWRTLSLAEDRMLPQATVSDPRSSASCAFLCHAHAFTDVPLDLAVFLRQRRRWTNGALMAMLWSFQHLPKLWSIQSSQPLARRLKMSTAILISNLSVLAALLASVVVLSQLFGVVSPLLADSILGHLLDAQGSTLSNVASPLNYQMEKATARRITTGTFAVLFASMWLAHVFLCAAGNLKYRIAADQGGSEQVNFRFAPELGPGRGLYSVSGYQRRQWSVLKQYTFLEPECIKALLVKSTAVLQNDSFFRLFVESLAIRYLMAPAWTLINVNFALSHLDDVSWGTKRLTRRDEKTRVRFRRIKIAVL
ncbi:MAG: hypothetical protein MHM6MM_002532 [Cercozoa sp. M6MM]